VKYVIIIPDGGADKPLPELGDQTPFEAASTPHLDALARSGRVGSVRTTPPGYVAGSDVCNMVLLGYEPEKYHTGRAPLEAAAIGVTGEPGQWLFRMNLVTQGEDGTDRAGCMVDHSAGGIDGDEAHAVFSGLMDYWRQREPDLAKDFELTPGVAYRSILVDRSGTSYAGMSSAPAHEIPNRDLMSVRPEGNPSVQRLHRLMDLATDYLASCEVNKARREQGVNPANAAWIWGEGTAPQLPSFLDRFGLKGGMLTSVDLLWGLARLIGWDVIECDGLTSFHDTDYAAQGRATIEALKDYDVVCCHVESPDEASHQGDIETKVACVEAIDEHIVGPVVEALGSFGDPEQDPDAEGWRVLVLPDHYTLCSTRKHENDPVPFLMAGAWVRSLVQRTYSEQHANESDLHIEPGSDLMEYFLRSGMKNTSR